MEWVTFEDRYRKASEISIRIKKISNTFRLKFQTLRIKSKIFSVVGPVCSDRH